MVVLDERKTKQTRNLERGQETILDMLSIIIPTLNEENYLPLLLESIKKQDFRDYEIIVADALSQDKTVQIAKKSNSLVIAGGLPARGKNNGAKTANNDLLLFLDADLVLPEGFFRKSLAEFEKRKLKVASFFLVFQKGKFVNFFLNLFYNLPILVMEKILPHGAMGILIKKEVFEKVNGFDEDIKLAEDHDLVRRAAKLAKFGLLRSSKIFVSDRRFKKDGWLRTSFKYMLCELHMIFIGPAKSDFFRYRFGHYSKNKKDKVE